MNGSDRLAALVRRRPGHADDGCRHADRGAGLDLDAYNSAVIWPRGRPAFQQQRAGSGRPRD